MILLAGLRRFAIHLLAMAASYHDVIAEAGFPLSKKYTFISNLSCMPSFFLAK